MSLLEQRSMFTMWAALPGPLILSADLRKSSMNSGRGLDADVLKILTNKEVRRCAPVCSCAAALPFCCMSCPSACADHRQLAR